MSNLMIRNATMNDLEKIVSIEETCFPPAEAAKEPAIKERLNAYSKGFFICEMDNEIVGFVNGAATDDSEIEDAFFESMDLHKDDGKNLVIFGLDVHPDFQRQGIARQLMNHFIDFAKSDGKERVVLTCKDHLIKYYESFGYENLGESNSSHGGAKWYDMVLKL